MSTYTFMIAHTQARHSPIFTCYTCMYVHTYVHYATHITHTHALLSYPVQVFPICVVFLLFLVHSYALPYLYWWQNILEMVTFCILLIMLLFRSVAITPGVLGLEGENEVSVPLNNDTMQGDLPGLDKLSVFLLFWYYLPVVVTAVSATVVLLYRLL